jgi:hypothetical protein
VRHFTGSRSVTPRTELTGRRSSHLPAPTWERSYQSASSTSGSTVSRPVLVGTSTSRCTPSTPVPFKENAQATARLRTNCPTCKNYVLPEDKCVRIWEVDKLEVRGLRGCVITCADPDDRLEPKVEQYREITPLYSLRILCAGMESSQSQENSRHTMEDTRGAWPQRASPTRLTAHSGGLQV